MADITKEPYAVWLEETLQELVDLHPTSIGIIAIRGNDTGTAYYNIRNRERWIMVQSILRDNLLDFLRVNAERISEILDGSDDGSDAEEEGET